MSCFTDLVGKGKGDRTFLWTVNQFGEVVIQRLDESHKVTATCVAFGINDFRVLFNKLMVVLIPLKPWHIAEQMETWQQVCDVLNSPGSSAARRKALSARRITYEVDPIRYSHDKKAYCVIQDHFLIEGGE